MAKLQDSFSNISNSYWNQDELVQVRNFLPPEALEKIHGEINSISHLTNRSFIPAYKQGGSLPFYELKQHCPSVVDLYNSPDFLQFLRKLTHQPTLQQCPSNDPHSVAVYLYEQEGDWIGWHYDKSYYEGPRYTVLLSVYDDSDCRLVCDLHTRSKDKETRRLDVHTTAGTLVCFNGDTIYHHVSKMGKDQRRIIISLQYPINVEMNAQYHSISYLKDCWAYFGWKMLLRKEARSALFLLMGFFFLCVAAVALLPRDKVLAAGLLIISAVVVRLLWEMRYPLSEGFKDVFGMNSSSNSKRKKKDK